MCAERPELREELAQSVEPLKSLYGMLHVIAVTVPGGLGAVWANGVPAVETPKPDPGVSLSPDVSRPMQDSVATFRPLVPPPSSPQEHRVPPGYQLLNEVGRGGMGVVFRARQLALNRVVALKMIRDGGQAGPEERLRFLAEAEAIAAVKHPGIVQVYDFGTHEGLPYFALEFCEGGSLADRLAGTPLPAEEAAQLVVAVAQAVQAAHERGIVHRDLKPGNVLLASEEGYGGGKPPLLEPPVSEATGGSRPPLANLTPKVTDFGLAKRLEGGGLTQTGVIMGTPSYVAPEQARGQKTVGPLADVYALGAILYECLTGRPPFLSATVMDTLMQVVNEEPVAPRQLNHRVPRDLEVICLRCLRKEPDKRYPGARDLADDLGRFLDGKPVLARPVGLVERAWRWGQRRPGVAGLLTALVVLTVAALTTVSMLYAQATRHAARALEHKQQAEERADELERKRQQEERNFKLAKQAVDECFLLAKDDPLFQPVTMRPAKHKLFEKALGFYENFRVERPDDRGIQRELALQHSTLGYITAALGRTRDAVKHYLNAEANYRWLCQAEADVEDHKYQLAYVYSSLATLHKALGDTKGALACHLQSRDVYRSLSLAHPTTLTYQAGLASSSNNIAILQAELGQKQEALDNYIRAAEAQRQLMKAQPNVLNHQLSLGRTLSNLGHLRKGLKQPKEAMAHSLEALDLQRKLVALRPKDASFRQDLAGNLTNVGSLQRELRQREAALASFLAARDEHRKLVASSGDPHAAMASLAYTLRSLGGLQADLGQREEALASHAQARDLHLKLVQAYPEVITHQESLAFDVRRMGTLQQALGQRKEALASFTQARDVQRRLARAHPDVPRLKQALAVTLSSLAALQVQLTQRSAALATYTEARDLRRQLAAGPEGKLELARMLAGRGHVLTQLGNPTEGLADLSEAVDLLNALQANDPHPAGLNTLLASTLGQRAEALVRLGQLNLADADWQRQGKLASAQQAPTIRLTRAVTLARSGLTRQAVAAAEAELARGEALPGRTLYFLGAIYARGAGSVAGNRARPLPEREKQAETYARSALRLLERAAEAGFFRNAAGRQLLDKETDLAYLRSREDFRALVRSLAEAVKSTG